MSINNVSDLITDQEMSFARLILSGTMNDREAAEAAGLNPKTAAYTKAKPCVRDYMLEHRAAVQQQVVAQEAEALRRLDQRREQVRERILDCLWKIAETNQESTRGSTTSQIKALTMIAAIEGLIPGRRAGASVPRTQSAPPPGQPQVNEAVWLREQKEEAIHPDPSTAPAQEEPEPAPNSAADASSESTFANPTSSSETMPSVPYAPLPDSAPDNRLPFSLKKNRFGRRR